MRRGVEVTAYKPQYILRLDEIPKCIEADGRVWPTFLTVRDTARLFHVSTTTVHNWIKRYDLPAVNIGSRFFVNVPEFNDWLLAHAWTPDTPVEDAADE